VRAHQVHFRVHGLRVGLGLRRPGRRVMARSQSRPNRAEQPSPRLPAATEASARLFQARQARVDRADASTDWIPGLPGLMPGIPGPGPRPGPIPGLVGDRRSRSSGHCDGIDPGPAGPGPGPDPGLDGAQSTLRRRCDAATPRRRGSSRVGDLGLERGGSTGAGSFAFGGSAPPNASITPIGIDTTPSRPSTSTLHRRRGSISIDGVVRPPSTTAWIEPRR
jgi:hypothetical protein